jgi:hypothetical protein
MLANKALLWRLCATESAAYKPSKKPVRTAGFGCSDVCSIITVFLRSRLFDYSRLLQSSEYAAPTKQHGYGPGESWRPAERMRHQQFPRVGPLPLHGHSDIYD